MRGGENGQMDNNTPEFDVKVWARTRMDKATTMLSKAEKSGNHSEWYILHLKARIRFYQSMIDQNV